MLPDQFNFVSSNSEVREVNATMCTAIGNRSHS